MTDIWVVNASPMIVLGKIGRLELLLSENRKVWVPDAVAEEIGNGPPDDPARRALEGGWNNGSVAVANEPAVIEWGLGPGETAVLSLARKMGATAVVDDRAARTAAGILGIRVIGTLGVILRARLQNRISSSVDVIIALRLAGMRISDEVIRGALFRTTGEIRPVV